MKISEIPVFSQFDVWKPYDQKVHDHSKLHGLTLYLVKAKKQNMFVNKTYNLIYGMFLKEFIKDCEILYFKQPYKVFKVDYRNITRELWQTNISDSYLEDVKIKKLIAHINFGLLEKMTNTASESYSFDDLREAVYYQHKVGGRINNIASHYDEEVEIDTDEFEMQQKENDKTHYCLTVSELKNGYVYTKELLLQHHNHKMYQDYNDTQGVWEFGNRNFRCMNPANPANGTEMIIHDTGNDYRLRIGSQTNALVGIGVQYNHHNFQMLEEFSNFNQARVATDLEVIGNLDLTGSTGDIQTPTKGMDIHRSSGDSDYSLRIRDGQGIFEFRNRTFNRVNASNPAIGTLMELQNTNTTEIRVGSATNARMGVGANPVLGFHLTLGGTSQFGWVRIIKI